MRRSRVESGRQLVELPPARQQFRFAQPALQPFAPAYQRLVDGFGRGSQTPLQDHEGKAHRADAAVVLQFLGAVELLAHVVGHLGVEARFQVGQLVGHGIGAPFGEERRAVELEQLLLDHTPHHVGDVDGMHTVAEAAFEAVGVEQAHEELEILFLAVVGRGRHQQQVARDLAQQLAEAVALGVVDLAAKEGGRHLVRLVADDQVPVATGRASPAGPRCAPTGPGGR